MRRALIAGLLSGITLLAAAAGGFAWWNHAVHEPGPLPEARSILIPHGGSAQLASSLEEAGVVQHRWLFRAAVWTTRYDGALHAAELAFPAHASIEQALAILRTGKPVEHRLTIPEGLTSQQIQVILAHADAAVGLTGIIPEGSVLPQTYDYEYGTERSAIVARAKAAMDRTLAAAWAGRVPDLAITTPYEALILASIVERETAKPSERTHIAAVYVNRLRLGMRLQADPTVVYSASGGLGVLDHALTKAELERDDPFNTYRSAGLPPAPICAPSAESLNAVLHPADSDDLFFVADGSGGHFFSHDFQTHDAAVARWRAMASPTSKGHPD